MSEPRFRPARAGESELLDEMTLAGVRHWGHHESHPEAYNGLVASLAEDDGARDGEATVYVLEEDGEVVAFYDLRDRGEHIELLRMFQRVDLIGTGFGRRLWEHCVAEARKRSDRMLVMSDPEAVGFYAAMGATLEKMQEVAPGFSLGVFWYDLR